MGAWSVEPTGNDEALEWISNSIEFPLIGAINGTIDRFLSDASDDTRKAELETAIALLLDLTIDPPTFKYVRLDIDYLARDQGLLDKSILAINRLQTDAKWLSGWNDPQEKATVLNGLLTALEALRCRPARRRNWKTGHS
jgi:hypothetical protein